MRNPVIEELDLSNYSGKADEEVKVSVSKKGFEIQEVEVIVVGLNGQIIEEGKTKKGLGNEWTFKTGKDNEKDPNKFIIRVKDRTGNISEKTF